MTTTPTTDAVARYRAAHAEMDRLRAQLAAAGREAAAAVAELATHATQREIAQALGITQSRVSQLLTQGRRSPHG